jgi:RNA polymerase sigma-70 factor (ECF subfamily)
MSQGLEPSDEALVRRIREGDGDAATVLFDRHVESLRASARARMSAAVRAKVSGSDVVQEAYLAAFCGLGAFEDRGEGSFAAWLRQILENKLRDEARRFTEAAMRDVGREVALDDLGGAALPARGADTPSSYAIAAESAGAVQRALESLSDDDRALLRLVDHEGLTFVEIGARLGRSPDAVRMHYGRVLDRLSRQLAE